MKITIQIFAKAPVEGQVKTRLGRKIGYRRATRLYRQMLQQTIATACAVEGARVELWCAPDRSHRFFRDCAAKWSLDLYQQTRGDLGKRMQRAVANGLQRSDAVLLIGADCVSLTADYLHQAKQQLKNGQDAVLGPAEDGGYVLLGLRSAPPSLFQAIAWSTPAVANTTRQRLRRLTFKWSELPVLWDLDTVSDLRRWRR